MNQKTVIVISGSRTEDTQCFGSLKKACDAHGWVYNTLIQKNLPLTHESWFIQRVKFN